MPGQYSQGFNFPLTKNITGVAGDQLLGNGGISFQLNPAILPATPEIEGQVLWRSQNFTGAITVKFVHTAVPDTVVGTELASQLINVDGWNDTGTFTFTTPTVLEWITIVTNNPTPFVGNVNEVMLYLTGVGGATTGMFLAS